MSRIEALLRDALREVANEIGGHDVPPLRLPARAPSLDGLASRADVRVLARRSHRARRGWLAPLAAATCLMAVALGISLVAGLPRGAPGGSRTCAPWCAVPIGSVPPYYIAVTGPAQPSPYQPNVAGIYATYTGRRLATVAAPGGQSVVNVSAAADDRTFAIAAEAGMPGSQFGASFYLVHLTQRARAPSAHTAASLVLVRGLLVPAGAFMDAFALSPRGDKLAVATEPDKTAPGISEQIQVLDLRTGAVRTWASPQGKVEGDTADPWSLSWASDDRTLAFNWYGARGAGIGPDSGLRLLDTAGPAGDIVRASRLSVRYFYRKGNRATAAGYLSDIALLTPDGRTAVAATTAFRGLDGGFAEFSAASGRLRQILGWKPMVGLRRGGPTDVLWVSPDGRALVVYAPPGHWNQFGILHGNRLRIIPRPTGIYGQAAAW